MPSLPSKTFTKYYPWNVEKNTSNYHSRHPTKQCCKITAQITFCLILTFATICPFLDWFVAHYPNLYEHKYKMYFVYNTYFGILPIPFAVLLFIIVYRNMNITKNIIIVTVLIISIILVFNSCILSYLNHEGIYTGQFIPFNSKCCKIINCNYFNPYWLSITLYPVTILILPYLILTITIYTKIKLNCTPNNDDPMNNQLINVNSNNCNKFVNTKSKIVIMTCLGMLFVLWTILFCCAFLPSQHLLRNYFVQVIYFWIVSTSIIKFICKRLSRVIDHARCPQLDHDHSLDISLEIITEFYVSSFYWVIYRYYTILYEEVTWKSFWIAKSMHICTEFYQSNIRMTKLYFDFTSKSRLNELFCGSKCDYVKWMVRNSIDITIRSLISCVINIYIAVNIFSQYTTGILNKIYGPQFTHKYISNAMERLGYSMLIEIILYGGTYVYFRYQYGFNLSRSFVNMYQACCKQAQFLMIIAALMNIGQNTSQRNF